MKIDNYIREGKIIFVGKFDKEYWSKKYPNEVRNYEFIDNVIISESSFSDEVLIFDFDAESKRLTFFYEYHSPIIIEIKNGTVDECADRIINCDFGVIEADLYDIKLTLGHGKTPSTYFSHLTSSGIEDIKELYASKQGIFLIIHAPITKTLNEIFDTAEKICSFCSKSANELFNVNFEEDINDYIFDIFISGLDVEEEDK